MTSYYNINKLETIIIKGQKDNISKLLQTNLVLLGRCKVYPIFIYYSNAAFLSCA